MATISLCMIVKNEADILARCLDLIADLMDEIIIVDTGSTDSAKELALKDMISTPCAEICYELGCYFKAKEDYDEAIL